MSRASQSADQLLRLLDEGHEVTLDFIATKLAITERHARRLIQAFRRNGIPVAEKRTGKQKWFFLPEEHRRAFISEVAFTEEETLALAVAAGAARAVLGATPLAEPARSAFSRLIDQLDPRVFHFSLRDQPGRWYIKAIAQTRIAPDVFTTLLKGLNQEQSVLIDYDKPTGPTQNRKVNPLCIAIIDRAVLLTAWCHLDRDYRHFSLARITRAVLCDPAFDPRPFFTRPADFDPELFYRPDFHGALTDGEVTVFRILVEPEVAHLFRERDYRPLQQIEEERTDGRLVVSYEGAGFEEWRSFFQSWGTKITVLDPPEMRERLRQDAEALAARYRKSDT